MLLGGFGMLMAFLRRYGFSTVSLTMLLTTTAMEWAVLFGGFARMGDGDGVTIRIGMENLIEGGLAAAAVLISCGAVLGKTNAFQLLVMAVVESVFFVLVNHVGYNVLGVADVGGSIFIHSFGAYFGLAVSFALSHRAADRDRPWPVQVSTVTSDLFSIVGTVLLWVFWPSFNAVLAKDEAGFHRAVINTHLSIIGSTIATFIASAFLGR